MDEPTADEVSALPLIKDALAGLAELAGLRPSAGRVWAELYLHGPLTAEDIGQRAGISTGAVSMGIGELVDLQVIHRRRGAGNRRFLYEVEDSMWQAIQRILKERTRARFAAPIQKIRDAEELLSRALAAGEPVDRTLFEQVRYLRRLSDFALNLFDAFVSRTRVEMKAARRWLSVSGRLGGEPLSRLRRRMSGSSQDGL